VQIGLPSEVCAIEHELHESVRRFRDAHPSIEISIHAYPYNLAESVSPVRGAWVALAEQTICLAHRIGASFVNFHAGYAYDAAKRAQHSELAEKLIPVISDLVGMGVKLCYDYGHGNLDEHGIDILHGLADRLGSVHAHDNDQLSDIHWPIGHKAQGTIDWDTEFRFLQEIHFQGAFILESYPKEQVQSLSFLENRFAKS
jgi:sugar phosphate isomerase/epimerase